LLPHSGYKGTTFILICKFFQNFFLKFFYEFYNSLNINTLLETYFHYNQEIKEGKKHK